MLLGLLREEDHIARFFETENHIARFVEGRGSYY